MKALRIILIIVMALFFVHSSPAQYRASANLPILDPSSSTTFNTENVITNGNPIASVTTSTTNKEATKSRSFARNFPSNFILSTYFRFDPEIAPTNFCAAINGNIVTSISTNQPIPDNIPLRQIYQENITNLFTQCNAQLINLNVNQSFETVGSPIVQNPNCSYDDGGFTVTFNRPLDEGNNEILTSLSLRSAGGDGNLDTADDIPNYQSIESGTYDFNQFIWLLPLSAGLYHLSYQSSGTNSLETMDPIVIASPPPLIYSVEPHSELSCFDSENGEVQIIINPANQGTPPHYYTINNTSQIPCTGLSTMVSSLGPDTVQFKVFDSKGLYRNTKLML